MIENVCLPFPAKGSTLKKIASEYREKWKEGFLWKNVP
jgi:hypothetical protein